jgi:RHS repeat-associated protein
VGIPSNAGYYASSIAYYPNLMVSQVVHTNNPADATKNLTDTYANDPNLMRCPASITVTTPTSAVRWSTGTYAYDGAGNVKAIGTHTSTYDKVSRLTASNQYLEPTSSVTLRTQAFSYDAFANLLAIGGSSARNTPTAPATNRLTTATYDASGNVTIWNGNAYTYDPFHLMWDYRTPSDEWVYLYTADDERAWSYKTDNTSLWTLRGLDGKVLREYTTNGTWSVAEDYVYRDGLLLATETPQGTRHLHLDHLGTPRLVSNNLGQQAAYHVYYPYGEEATAFNQDTVREKFTGHERDLGNPAGSGDDLDYMHARFFSPLTGRFLGPDLIEGKPQKPQSWNRYTYSVDNTLRYVDPTGDEPIDSSLLQFFALLFGEDFSTVDVHAGPGAGLVSAAFDNALAVTIGEDIYLRPDMVGDYQSKSLKGVALLAHELTHVVHIVDKESWQCFLYWGDSIALIARQAWEDLLPITRLMPKALLLERRAS